MVLETLLIGLGTSVAKAVLKTLMPGQDVADAAVDAVLDLMKSEAGSDLEKRKANRAVEDIGDRIAANFRPLLEAEGVGFDEDRLKIVTTAVVDAISAAKLTPDVLAQIDLAPERVAERIRATPIAMTLDETRLFDSIVHEASQQIVDVASKLPQFTERTFGELLKREGQIQRAVDDISRQLEAIRREMVRSNPKASYQDFETEYRRQVARNLDILELIGANVSNAYRRYSLSVAYIALTVDKTRKAGKSSTDEVSKVESSVVLVDECLAGTRHLLIRGVAGSGKTTLLQWIAVNSANSKFDNALKDWNNTVPFFIRLRQLSDGPLPQPKDFPALVVPAIAGKMPDGWVEELLGSGRALMLVDGVDEVSPARQEEVRQWLADLEVLTKERTGL